MRGSLPRWRTRVVASRALVQAVGDGESGGQPNASASHEWEWCRLEFFAHENVLQRSGSTRDGVGVNGFERHATPFEAARFERVERALIPRCDQVAWPAKLDPGAGELHSASAGSQISLGQAHVA